MVNFYTDKNYFHGATLGFDKFFSDVDAFFQQVDKFPHHNIIKVADDSYKIEIALAGFDKKDIKVELKEGKLSIEGKRDKDEVEFLHHGISNRNFLKSFRLVDTMLIKEATMENGILSILLENVLPEEKKAKIIEVQ